MQLKKRQGAFSKLSLQGVRAFCTIICLSGLSLAWAGVSIQNAFAQDTAPASQNSQTENKTENTNPPSAANGAAISDMTGANSTNADKVSADKAAKDAVNTRAQSQQSGQQSADNTKTDIAAGTPVETQEKTKEDEDKSWYVSFIEKKLSTTDRKISITGVDGILSSTPSVKAITVADSQGAWLKINNAKLDWNRLSLLRGRLSINSLNADSVEVLRKPLKTEAENSNKDENDDFLTKLTKGNFALPSFLLDIDINALNVDTLTLGKALAGQDAHLTAQGKIQLTSKILNIDINAQRQQAEGGADKGKIKLAANYDIQKENLSVDSHIIEAENGILANLLKIEGRPALQASATGGGENGDFKINLAMKAANQPLLDGVLSAYNGTEKTKQTASDSKNTNSNANNANSTDKVIDSKVFDLTASGQLGLIAPQDYKALLAEKTNIKLHGAFKKAGGLRIDELSVDNNGPIYFTAQAETLSDGFLRRLYVNGGLGAEAQKARQLAQATTDDSSNNKNHIPNTQIQIGSGEKRISLDAARIHIDYGRKDTDAWTSGVTINQLVMNKAQIGDVKLGVKGYAENLDTPDKRYISAAIEGSGTNMLLRNINQKSFALPEFMLGAKASWNSNAPITLQNAQLTAGQLEATAQGEIKNKKFTGSADIVAPNASDIAKMLGRKIEGQGRLNLKGDIDLMSGAFDTDIAGNIHSVHTDNTGINGILGSDIAISGGLARDKNAFTARNLRVVNDVLQFYADGSTNDKKTSLDFGVNLSDMAVLTPFIKKFQQQDTDFLAADEKIKQKLTQNLKGQQIASGGLKLRGAARGHNKLISLALNANIANGVWNNQKIQDLNISLNGLLDNNTPNIVNRNAEMRGAGKIGGDALHFTTNIQQYGKSLKLDNIDFNWGQNSLAGALEKQNHGLFDGNLAFKTDDINSLARLAFMKGTGKADIDLQLQAEPKPQTDANANSHKGKYIQDVSFKALINNLSVGYMQNSSKKGQNTAFKPLFFLQHLEGEGGADNIFNMPRAKGNLKGQNLQFGDYGFKTFTINSKNQDLNSDIDLHAVLTNGLVLDAGGIASPLDMANQVLDKTKPVANWQFALNNFTIKGLPSTQSLENTKQAKQADNNQPLLKQRKLAKTDSLKMLYDAASPSGVQLDLLQPARFTFAQEQILRVDGLQLKLSQNKRGGKNNNSIAPAIFKLDGDVTKRPDLTANVQNFPLAWADLIRPDLGLRGIFNGNAHVAGTRELPLLNFDVSLANIKANPLIKAGVPSMDLQAKGRTHNQVLTLDAILRADDKSAKSKADSFNITTKGQVLLAKKTLQLNTAINNASLGILHKVLQNTGLNQQDIRGILNANAAITGTYDNPKAQVSANISKLSSTMLRSGGVAPIEINAEGIATKKQLNLQKLALQGPRNVHFASSGIIPFSGAGLNIKTNGNIPLALANGFLSGQGAKLGGFLNLDGAFSGSIDNPQMQGNFSVRDGQFMAAPWNLRLKPIEVNGRLSGNDIIFDRAKLHSYSGGYIDIAGKMGVSLKEKLPLNLQMQFKDFGYSDGKMITAKLGGGLNFTGGVLQGLTISGKIDIPNAELRVPDSFGGATLLEIENKYPTAAILLTQKRAGLKTDKEKKEAAKTPKNPDALPKFDIEVSAPHQIFVRGRGLDAEMGGDLKLTGRLDQLNPTGSLNLIRGRFDILAQRLVFTEGEVKLTGNFNPDLHFVATTKGEDVAVTITLSGTPNDLKMDLSSDPSLPQDEILARLIFGRSFSELSAFQIAQLVDATAELTGVTSGSVFGALRAKTGLDQLDVNVDSEGNTDVAAGSYILDKVYLGVETSSDGESKGTANIDITPNLKAKGTIGSDSNSDYGIFYERDY